MKQIDLQVMNAIIESRCHDPFSYLGKHIHNKLGIVIRCFQPYAQQVWLLISDNNAADDDKMQVLKMDQMHAAGIFSLHLPDANMSLSYRLRCCDIGGHRWESEDHYRFSPLLSEFDLHLISEGKHLELYNVLGARVYQHEGIDGVAFGVWAPNAKRISVVGDFNNWDGRSHQMRVRGVTGVWELFIPHLEAGTLYKYELLSEAGDIFLKTDPLAKAIELRPATASIVHSSQYNWEDEKWMLQRPTKQALEQPYSVYEVHLASWRRDDEGNYLSYRELAHQLVEYCQWMGFTHIELLPISEYPFDGSWGYQTVGYFAPSSRFGSPDEFRYFVDYCHQNNLGVLLDWVPAHFPKDAFALARFDGSALYEHADTRLGEHRDWGTLIFNFGRNEVCNFLLASALYWLKEFHLDGLRVDAVASMLYLDYSREEGEWLPNKYGGNENLEAVAFLRSLNILVHERHPGAVTMAEESTSWPQVSHPVYLGGLGFTMKWNMGWMNDTLRYFGRNPVFRRYHHNETTFSLMYAFSENFMLPLSHDEVVHGKGSIFGKMPGDDWQKCANLRLLYGWMFTHPGKKLLFMGLEFGQEREWDHDIGLDWHLCDNQGHRGVQLWVRDLNNAYKNISSLHELDVQGDGFSWIDCHDAEQSVLVYQRNDAQGNHVIIVLNLTPAPRQNYRVGVPATGFYREILNSDASVYGGSNMGNNGGAQTESITCMQQQQSLSLTLPPLSTLVFALD
ncbi:MAG: 1,4-alpha-glucan branching protein GlgB [Mariprofundales bacterium]